MRSKFFLLFSLICLNLEAQFNVVPENSFENPECESIFDINQLQVVTQCTFSQWVPFGEAFLFSPGNVFIEGYHFKGVNYNEVNLSVSDNFFGSQNAADGQNYAGLVSQRVFIEGTIEADFLGIKLNPPVQEGIVYTMRFNVSKMEMSDEDAKFKVILAEDITNRGKPKGKDVEIFDTKVSDSDNWVQFSINFLIINSNTSYEYLFFKATNRFVTGFGDKAAGFFLDDISIIDKCLADNPCSRTADHQISPIYTTQTVESAHALQIDNLNNVKIATMLVRNHAKQVVLTKTITCANGITGPIYWDGNDIVGAQVLIAVYEIILSLTNDCGTFEFSRDVQKAANFNGVVSDFQCNACNVVTPEPCCSDEPDISIDNLTICGPSPPGGFLYQSVNNINIGPNVTISGDADVTFFAGNEIIGTNPHDVAVTGANVVTAEIVPCTGKNKTSDNNYTGNDNNIIPDYEYKEYNQTTYNTPDTSSTQTQQPGFNIYPNPYQGSTSLPLKSDKLFVDITGNKDAHVLIVVVDMLGIERYSKVFVLKEDKYTLAIDPEGKLPAGVYMVIAASDNEIYRKKIVIQ